MTNSELPQAGRYAVAGLTCGHCAAAVRSEVSDLTGVTDVQVDLVPGGVSTLRIVSDAPVPESDLAAAVAEAGDYHLV